MPVVLSLTIGLLLTFLAYRLAERSKLPALKLPDWLKQLSTAKLLCAIIFAGVALRVIWILFIPPVQTSDFLAYWQLALGFAENNTYSEVFKGAVLNAYRPPGYPLLLYPFILLFGDSPWTIIFSNLLMFTLCAFLLYDVVARWFDEAVALITTFLIAIWPSWIFYSGLAATELPFMLMLIGGVWAFDRVRDGKIAWSLFAGLFLGFGALIKATLLVAPIIVAGFFLAQKSQNQLKKAGSIALLCLGMALVILPWSYRNYTIFEQIMQMPVVPIKN